MGKQSARKRARRHARKAKVSAPQPITDASAPISGTDRNPLHASDQGDIDVASFLAHLGPLGVTVTPFDTDDVAAYILGGNTDLLHTFAAPEQRLVADLERFSGRLRERGWVFSGSDSVATDLVWVYPPTMSKITVFVEDSDDFVDYPIEVEVAGHPGAGVFLPEDAEHLLAGLGDVENYQPSTPSGSIGYTYDPRTG